MSTSGQFSTNDSIHNGSFFLEKGFDAIWWICGVPVKQNVESVLETNGANGLKPLVRPTLSPSWFNVVLLEKPTLFVLVDAHIQERSIVSDTVSSVEFDVFLSRDGHGHCSVLATHTGANKGIGDVVFQVVDDGVCGH